MAPTPHDSDLSVLRLVAHELRAHLTVLNGYSALLVEDPAVRRDPRRVEHALSEMRSHLATLNDISTHLAAAVGRSGPARLPLVLDEVDLADAAEEALSMAAETARRHRVELRLESAEGPASARADRFQLVTALRNLLDNACAYGPEGGRVVVQLRGLGEEVELRVRDQGGGLGPLGADAFEPLRRGGETAEGEGLGLGLSLVAEVARAHGGEPTWGRDDQGAWIGLRFPRQRVRHTRRG